MKYAIAAIALIASTPAHAGTYAETVQRTDAKKSASKVREELCIESAKLAALAWDEQAEGRSLPKGPTPYIDGLANAGAKAYLTGMRRQNLTTHVYNLCVSGELDDVIALRY